MQILVILCFTFYVEATTNRKNFFKMQDLQSKNGLLITLTAYDISGNEDIKGTKLSTPVLRINGEDISHYKGLLDFSMICFGPGAPYFEMNSRTGDVYLKQDFDADKGVSLTTLCTLTVKDETNNKTGSTRLTITIHDVNDNSPTFQSHVMYIHVNHHAPIGSVIADLSDEAVDDDVSDKFNTIAYALIPAKSDEDCFIINEDRKILVNKDLSSFASSHEFLKMTVTATDYGGHQDTATIFFIFDQNRHPLTSAVTRTIVFFVIVIVIYIVIFFKRTC